MANIKLLSILFVLFIAVFLVSGCLGGLKMVGKETLQEMEEKQEERINGTVLIRNFAFYPQTMVVKTGTTVKWANMDSVTHDVTNDATGSIKEGELFSADIEPHTVFSYTFDKDGGYPYHCAIHPDMKGIIIVGTAVSNYRINSTGAYPI